MFVFNLYNSNNEFVKITLLPNQGVKSLDYWDSNWLRCECLFKTKDKEYPIKYKLDIFITDVIRLKECLMSFCAHELNIVQFRSMEENLNLTINSDYSLTVTHGFNFEYSFSTENITVQNLRLWVDDLTLIINQNPIIGISN